MKREDQEACSLRRIRLGTFLREEAKCGAVVVAVVVVITIALVIGGYSLTQP